MRESGILIHISSLPGPYGIGTMGAQAYRFVDFLKKAGQRYWQILPLTPTGYGNSPYQSVSSRAGNPYLIDLDVLISQGLLTQTEVDGFDWGKDICRVDYGKLYRNRFRCLQLAFQRFSPDRKYLCFLEENQDWLEDYALFMTLKERYGGVSWLEWPVEYRLREKSVLEQLYVEEQDTIAFQYFLQYMFYLQWNELHSYAAQNDVRIIGDIPIYVPMDSVDVWGAPELFQLDADRRPTMVAGCPPDAFTADGQLWGNPLYNWEKLEHSQFAWWIRRISGAEKWYDVIRLDHFRGFESYWAIPYGDTTARNGIWVKGPGMRFFQAIQQVFPNLHCIAEDLGYLTEEVRLLQLESGYPGMKVLEFAFDSRESGNYIPYLYPENSVCYTGTHDNATIKQWIAETSPEDLDWAKAYLGLNHGEGYVWGMIRGGMSSASQLFIAQMQDYLELGSEGRMNTPGQLSDANWTWRADPDFDSDILAQRIRKITDLFGRMK